MGKYIDKTLNGALYTQLPKKNNFQILLFRNREQKFAFWYMENTLNSVKSIEQHKKKCRSSLPTLDRFD